MIHNLLIAASIVVYIGTGIIYANTDEFGIDKASLVIFTLLWPFWLYCDICQKVFSWIKK